jgi:hypothetical protein
MKTEEEIRKEFDDFINGLNKTMSDISRSFHKHDGMVGWDKTSPSAIEQLQKHLLDYQTVMAMRDAAVAIKNFVFEEEEA